MEALFNEHHIVDLEENVQLYLIQKFLLNVNALKYGCISLSQV